MNFKKVAPTLKRVGVTLGLIAITILTWPWAWLPTAWGMALGAGLGRLLFIFMPYRRRVAVGNLEMVKESGFLGPEIEAEATAREAFANLGRSGWEAIRYYHRGLAPFWGDCQLEGGREHMDAALAESRRTGRGVMMVTGHCGNWELMCHYLKAVFGLSTTLVGRDSGSALADAMIHRLRTKDGSRHVSKRGAARAMFSALRSGDVVGILFDQAVLSHIPPPSLPFLGLEASINVAPFQLAQRIDVQVLEVLFRREGRTNYCRIMPPMKFQKDIDQDKAALAVARQMNDWLGEHIRLHPDQWMWGHRRWKTAQGVEKDSKSLV